VLEDPVAFYQIDRASKQTTWLIQDQACGVFTDFLAIRIFNKDDHSLLKQKKKVIECPDV